MSANIEWVACKDRLPRERGTYLVYEHSYPEPIRICAFGTSQRWDNGRDKIRRKVPGQGITHWMPLPKPPIDAVRGAT